MYNFIIFEHRPCFIEKWKKFPTQFSLTIFSKSQEFTDTRLLVWKYS